MVAGAASAGEASGNARDGHFVKPAAEVRRRNEEWGAGAHGPITADLWLTETEQGSFVTEIELSGKGLARYRTKLKVRVRFQPLPIRTAREVFPQTAHPVGFIEKVMGRVG